MPCSIDQYDIHGNSRRRLRQDHPEFMDLCYCAYYADHLLAHPQRPGAPSRAAEPLTGKSLVTAARQHNLKISSQLPRTARIVRGNES
jgi:hypothetical protein